MKFAEIPALCAALFCATAVFAAPIRVVFDTDMALALSMLHRFQKEGKAEIAAVLVNKGAPAAPVFCAIQNEYCGSGNIPVGHIADGKTPEPGAFAGKIAGEKNPDGSRQTKSPLSRGRNSPPKR